MNILIKNKYDHLFMKEDQLFVCNIPHVQISQTTMLLLVLLVLWESP
jgi:hypothetical protein